MMMVQRIGCSITSLTLLLLALISITTCAAEARTNNAYYNSLRPHGGGGWITFSTNKATKQQEQTSITDIRGGSSLIPSGYNPFGYKITALGEEFLKYDGSLDSDIGRFLASLKKSRKRFAALKEQWVEVVKVSKTGQSMRILRQLQELLDFCLKAGLID